MAGRDASSSGGRATSQSPLHSSRSKLSASASAAERERLALKEQLAAWRERRDQQRLQQQQPTIPPQPKPFSAMSSNGPSDQEKKLLLHRRRELMRTPSKPTASPPHPRRHDQKEDATPSQNGPPARPPPPQTPPPRNTHHAGHRLTRPAPPQTPPRAPRPPPSRTARIREQAPHEQRLSTETEYGVAVTESKTPSSPMTTLSTVSEASTEQQQRHQGMTALELNDSSQTTQPEQDGPPSPCVGNQSLADVDQRSMDSDSGAETPASVEALEAEELLPNQPPFSPPSILSSPQRLVDSTIERGLIGRSVQASPRKQVRFADDEHVEFHPRGDDIQAFSENKVLSGVAHEVSEDESSDPLTDSQSSWCRERMEQEQLMSDVEALLYQHTEEVIVTDRLVQHHAAADGRENIEEAGLTTRSEMLSSTPCLEAMMADKRVPAEDIPILGAKEDDQSDTPILDAQDDDQVHAPVLDTQQEDQVGARGDHEIFTPTGDHVASEDTSSTNDKIDDYENERRVRLRVVKSPVAKAASHRLSSPTQKSVTVTDQRFAHFRNTVIAFFILAGLVACDLLYPQSPVSRTLRVAKRVALGMASYIGSRATVWLWHSLINPASTRMCGMLMSSNAWLKPRAKAMQSLTESGWEGFLTLYDRAKAVGLKITEDIAYGGKSIFNTISSRVADAVLSVASPFMRPPPSVDPETIATAHDRLQELTEAQSQLRVKVNDLLRTQEEWALDELERMKQRRVAYSTATNSILTETTKMMLQAVQEAKLSTADHIQTFTNELTQELMASIKPELDEYARLEVGQSQAQGQHEAALKKLKLEEAARLEILRVEAAKRQAASKLHDESARDRASLLQEKVFVEVDVMEIVETVEEAVHDAVDVSTSAIVDSLDETIGDVEAIAKDVETELDAVVKVTEEVIERAERQVVDEIAVSLAEREQELKREHDAAEAEIERIAGEEVKRLQHEREAAEALARAALLAEEAVMQEIEEARRALDAQLEAGKMELEQELVRAASIAVEVEVVEVEKVVVEEEVLKEVIETQLVEDVGQLLQDMEQVETEAIVEVGVVEAELTQLKEIAESALDQVAFEEVKQLEREEAAAQAMLGQVAVETEQQIASSAGIQLPFVGPAAVKANVTPTTAIVRSIVEETERWHMQMLSIGFVVLALATAFVLYPRWRRLIANPTREGKAMSSADRRRRRRSWQRPAQVSDSEPEEVMLLQTGSSSEDGLSETNEPEPEVVEMMSGAGASGDAPRSTVSRSTRTTYSSYSRTADVSDDDERGGRDHGQGDRALTSPLPTRRAFRQRRR